MIFWKITIRNEHFVQCLFKFIHAWKVYNFVFAKVSCKVKCPFFIQPPLGWCWITSILSSGQGTPVPAAWQGPSPSGSSSDSCSASPGSFSHPVLNSRQLHSPRGWSAWSGRCASRWCPSRLRSTGGRSKRLPSSYCSDKLLSGLLTYEFQSTLPIREATGCLHGCPYCYAHFNPCFPYGKRRANE